MVINVANLSCSRAVLQSCGLAIVWSCSRAVVQSCDRVVVQQCSYVIRCFQSKLPFFIGFNSPLERGQGCVFRILNFGLLFRGRNYFFPPALKGENSFVNFLGTDVKIISQSFMQSETENHLLKVRRLCGARLSSKVSTNYNLLRSSTYFTHP